MSNIENHPIKEISEMRRLSQLFGRLSEASKRFTLAVYNRAAPQEISALKEELNAIRKEIRLLTAAR